MIKEADILLPKVDLNKWSVIACDQFTSDENYWNNLKDYVKNSPSSLNLIFPEVFLKKGINTNCNDTLKKYIKNDVFYELKNSMILINRKTSYVNSRLGLVCCIDLEDYDFSPNSKSLIRTSEGTVKERVLSRIELRKSLSCEFPHIMLLFDDREQKILENLYKNKDNLEKIYDFDLNFGGGHLEGYKINNVKNIKNLFESLLDEDYLLKTFNTKERIGFIVGDGNHSLATAKTLWDSIKINLTDEERQNHINRYCLVEICNINDYGIEFHPIHRLIENYDENFINSLENLYKGNDFVEYYYYVNNNFFTFKLPSNATLAIKLVQDFIENYKGIKIDYIHDKESLIDLCDKKKGLGIMLKSINKEEIFSYVINYGILPKKSFSIGHATEKRYYLEGRIIKNLT